MNRATNYFYSTYIFLYLPVAQLFYHVIGIQWIDELFAVMLGTFFISQSIHSGTLIYQKELKIFLLVVLFYICYSLLLQIVNPRAILFDVLQQFKPYITFYATTFLNPHFSKEERIFMTKYIKLLSFIYLCISFPLNIITEHAEFGQSCLILALLYWYFSSETKSNIYISIIILTFGLLCLKAKFYGEYILFVFIALFLHQKFKINSFKTILSLISIGIIILFFTWSKFQYYYIDGFNSNELARPISYLTGITILWDFFPFGCGLGSFSVEAARSYYSPIYYMYDISHIWGLTPEDPSFLADAFYPSFAEIGIFGILLFFCFWQKRYHEICQIEDLKYYKIALISACALLLESTADTSYLSGPGMAYFMILALSINAGRSRFGSTRKRSK